MAISRLKAATVQAVQRPRQATVEVNFGRIRLSRKVFLLGLSLVLLQIADALLTYSGLKLFGVEMERNLLLKQMMLSFGSIAFVLFITKAFAIAAIIGLMVQAHSRRWIRPVMALMSWAFIGMAVVPWSVILLGASL